MNFSSFKCASFVLAVVVSVGLQLPAQGNPSHKHKHQKYRLIDLGTFGGPQAFVNPASNGGPYINRAGTVVGQAQTTVPLNPDSNSFLCYPGPNVNHGFKRQNGRTIDLGALSPNDTNCSDALGINDRGAVAGLAGNGLLDPLLGLSQFRAVVWKNGRILNLGTFGGNESLASSINNRGQVTGFALNAVPDPFSIYDGFFMGFPNGTQTRAFLWQDGRMQDLGTLGGPDAAAFNGFINEAGQISGMSYTNSTPNSTTGFPTMHPFLWSAGHMKDLGSLGGNLGLAFGLNSHGQVVGISTLAGDEFAHGYFWDGRHMRDLGTLGGDTSEADSLNDSGEVVGAADFAGDQLHDAFLWRDGRMIDLGNLGLTSHAYSINNHRQVVGLSRLDTATTHSFLWEDGEMVDLNDLVSPQSDVVLTDFETISDNGEIAGTGLPPGCLDEGVCGHAYVLIPDGDCDPDNEARIAVTQASAAVIRRNAAAMITGNSKPRTPIEKFRSMMRQRSHFPGQAVELRD